MTDPLALVNAVVLALPSILAMFKTAPGVTDADVLKALRDACDETLRKDEEWLLAHPPGDGSD